MADDRNPELSRLLDARDPHARDEAWASFVSQYSRLFLHTARSGNPDRDGAMDGYTYVLEALREDDCRRLRAYVADPSSKFTTWLVVVVRRLCLDHHRQRYGRGSGADPADAQAERQSRRRLVDLVAAEIDPDQLSHPAATGADAQVEARAQTEAVQAVLAGLAPRDRLLLALRFEQDLSAREIGQIMGFQTQFHVYRRLKALLVELRGSLRRRGIEGSES